MVRTCLPKSDVLIRVNQSWHSAIGIKGDERLLLDIRAGHFDQLIRNTELLQHKPDLDGVGGWSSSVQLQWLDFTCHVCCFVDSSGTQSIALEIRVFLSGKPFWYCCIKPKKLLLLNSDAIAWLPVKPHRGRRFRQPGMKPLGRCSLVVLSKKCSGLHCQCSLRVRLGRSSVVLGGAGHRRLQLPCPSIPTYRLGIVECEQG